MREPSAHFVTAYVASLGVPGAEAMSAPRWTGRYWEIHVRFPEAPEHAAPLLKHRSDCRDARLVRSNLAATTVVDAPIGVEFAPCLGRFGWGGQLSTACV